MKRVIITLFSYNKIVEYYSSITLILQLYYRNITKYYKRNKAYG